MEGGASEHRPAAGVVMFWLLVQLVGYLAVALSPVLLLWLRDKLRHHRSACVLVLGDLGRSPRMQYHVLSLAEHFPRVDVVANGGSRPLQAISDNPNVFVHTIPAAPALKQGTARVWFLLYAPFKVFFQVSTAAGLRTLRAHFAGPSMLQRPCGNSHPAPQNPPAIPSLPVAAVVCRIRSSRLVVDWHNYGYTILALTVGPKHPLVALAKWIEKTFGTWADASLCVTDAMNKDLKDNWGISGAVTLYDRPPAMFARCKVDAAHELMMRLSAELGDALEPFADQRDIEGAAETTLLTYQANDGSFKRREDRPALLVSGTSWTPDEDFGILLASLREYDACKSKDPSAFPSLLCIVTGKGPMRAHFEEVIAREPLRHVRVVTAWLASEDYPRLLGTADVGISLHTSSSGLDLPMKVVDMFGCQLPCCAIGFPCLGELVRHGYNGLIFSGQEELTRHLQRLLGDFPRAEELSMMRSNLRQFRQNGWTQNWDRTAKPVFLQS